MRRPAAVLATFAVVLGAAGCGGTEGADEARTALDAVCRGADVRTTDLPKDEIDDLDDPVAVAACDIDGDQASAWTTKSNPFEALVNSGDGWESGDGSSVESAVRRLDGGRYLFVRIHRVDEQQDIGLLDPLEKQGFRVFAN